jgi:diaminopimelate decarboxylase
MKEARSRGHEIEILDIGGGLPIPYDARVPIQAFPGE